MPISGWSAPAPAKLQVSGDVGREDAPIDRVARRAGGDEQVAVLFGQHTRFDAIALLSPERRETIAAGRSRYDGAGGSEFRDAIAMRKSKRLALHDGDLRVSALSRCVRCVR